MNDTIKIALADSEAFDKKQIAFAIRNSTLNDILTCSLKVICDGIDKLSEEYIAKTSSVIKNFSF